LLYLFTDPTTRKRAVDAEMTYSDPYDGYPEPTGTSASPYYRDP